MKLISKNVHDRLLRAAARSERKYADQMHKKKIPVEVRILKELKLPVSAEAEAKSREVDAKPLPAGHSHNVCSLVPLAEYLKALKAYKPDEPKAVTAQ